MGSYDNYSKIRDSKGLNDSKVAQLSGVSKSTISEWKKGKIQPKVDKIERISKILGVTVDAIMRNQFDTEEFYGNVKAFVESASNVRPVRSTISFDFDDLKLLANIKADPNRAGLFAWLAAAPGEDVLLVLNIVKRLGEGGDTNED